MSEDRLVRSELIPGRIDHFRAIMERFLLLHALYTRRWEASDGKILFITEVRKERDGQDVTLPTRATWRVIFAPIHGPGVAAIEAYELAGDKGTWVDFVDGYAPEFPEIRDPIGPPFQAFVDIVMAEARQMFDGRTSAEDGTDKEQMVELSKPDVPKRKTSREKWIRAYSVIKKVREDLLEAYTNGDTRNPTPKIEDYRDALADEMGWSPASKTLRKIIMAGDNGQLEMLVK